MRSAGIFLIVSFLLQHSANTQVVSGFPPSTRWRQIDTDTVRVIFTEGATNQANRIATLINKMAAENPTTLGSNIRKLNVILHSNTTLANGYVSLAPYRSEFYLIPGANIFDFGGLPWSENLAIHEYRHAQQFTNGRNGLSKLLFYLGGEGGQAIGNVLAVPGWFWEGDAVHTETALTQQGRGRLPFFLSEYNSLWLEGKNYSWMKLRNGSYKDYVPTHYHLGYLLVNYGYLKYGDEFWKKVFRDATAYKGIVYPMQQAIKRHSGVDFKTFRNDAFNFYKEKLGPSKDTETEKNKTVTNYYHPQFISEDSIVYLKASYNKLTAFYIKDKTGEHKIARRSLSTEEWFSYRNNKIAYTAYSTNPRWSLDNYSDIRILDIHSGSETKLTSKGKYFTPDFSPSGDKLISVFVNDSLHTELHLLDATTGTVEKSIDIDRQLFLFNPRFVDENTIVIGVRSEDARMSLQLLNLNTNEWQQLTPSSYKTVGQPFVSNNTIYFTANYNGNDDVYALNLADNKIIQLTSGKTGNYFASAYGDTLVYSKFTSTGLSLQQQKLPTIQTTELNQSELVNNTSMYPVAETQPEILAVDTRVFAHSKYKQSTGLFNFHTWQPTVGGSEYGFAVFGNNVLNTFSTELYYRHNINETSNTVGTTISYGGFFPVLSLGAEYTKDRTLKSIGRTYNFDQAEARLGYNIPLNYSQGKTSKFLNFGSNYVFNHLRGSRLRDSIQTENTSYLHHFISYQQQRPRAYQQLYPKLGVSTILNHRHLISKRGYQFLGGVQAYLPSFGNHSIVAGAVLQETDTNNVVLSNRFPNSRGYSEPYFSRMWKGSVNYHFPLFYPDFGFANILYFQRVRGNLFYDYTRVYSGDKTQSRNLRSVGTEILFDTQWWNMLPISLGVRYSYLMDQDFTRRKKHQFEVIIPIDILPD